MILHMLRRVVPVCLVSLLPAQAISWFEGSSTASLALRRVDEANPSATPTTVLADVELLPLEMTGRTRMQELDPTRSRRLTRNGVTRIDLPQGGRVLAYRRAAGQTYGYLLIGANGNPTVLLEGGAVAGQSPFGDRIGVSADGRWAAASSRAGDRLFILRLDGGTFASTRTPARSLLLASPVELQSIMPGRAFVFFATGDERVRRCAMADGGQIEDVGPPAIAGARVKSEMALSGDGTRLVYLYGVQPAFSLWSVGETGPALRLNAPVAKYEEPNYLPEFATGPKLLLNADGTRLMYTDATSRDEIYLMDTTGATATTQVTGDHNFEPYIGIGIFPTFAAATLVLGVGDPDRFDVVAAATADLPVVNLTMTGPNLVRPFAPGTLVPDAIALTGGSQLLITDHPLGGAMRLLLVDPVTHAARTVADRLRRLPSLGDSKGGWPDVLVAAAGGDVILNGVSALPVLVTPPGVGVTSEVLLGSAFRVVSIDAGGVSATAFLTAAGGVVALPPVTGPQRAGITELGNLVLDGPGLLFLDPRRGATTITTSGAVRVLVSGRGV